MVARTKRERRASEPPRSPVEWFEDLRQDYNAAKSSRYRRRRTGTLSIGTNADWHYRVQADYLRIMEQARDMDRNDPIPGQIVDRAVQNTINDGIEVDPQTPDRKLNADLKDRFAGWASDPAECDISQEHTFHELSALNLRQTHVDGDMITLLMESGHIQLVEGHRCRKPTNTTLNVVHGVLLDDQRKRLEYWLTKDDIDPWVAIQRVYDVEKYPVRDADGNRILCHTYNPKRVSQTRGISAFAPIFDCLGMAEDINFAKMVQQQVVSCFAIFRKRPLDFEGTDPGPRGTTTLQTLQGDGSTRTIEGIAPGMEVRGEPGEELQGFSPSVPNAEFFEHMKLILTLVGINLGMPLVLVLMDASETNFSGWRGAVDQARRGFMWNQKWFTNRFHRPIYEWKIRQFAADDPALRAAMARYGKDYFAHRWSKPKWPYIDPLKDAAADLMRLRNGMTSPRRYHADQGEDWPVMVREIVEDNTLAIMSAKRAAEAINKKYPDQPVHWREVLSLPAPDGMTIAIAPESGSESGDSQNPSKKPAARRRKGDARA